MALVCQLVGGYGIAVIAIFFVGIEIFIGVRLGCLDLKKLWQRLWKGYQWQAPHEVESALSLEAAIVGVNSRNLKTLKTDLAVARDLAAAIPVGRLSVAESGIRTRADIESLESLGYDGFLIGETLMRAPDRGAALKELCSG